MKVEIVEATQNPEEVVCKAARNDYMSEWIGDKSFEDVMGTVDGDTMQEKKENLLTHLMRRGHFGPFEHPHITFTVKGMSRITMAQITRHRHASFDVQSLRYTKPKLGVSADENVLNLPAGNGKKRHGGCKFDLNQEEEILKWYEEGFSVPELTRVLEYSSPDEVRKLLDANRRGGRGDMESNGESRSRSYRTSFFDPNDEWAMQVLGYLWSKATIFEDVVVLTEKSTEREYANMVATSVEPDAYLLSVDGEEVKLTWRSELIVEALRDLGFNDDINRVLKRLSESSTISFFRGLLEGNGGINGDKLYLTGDESTVYAFGDVLEGISGIASPDIYDSEGGYTVEVEGKPAVEWLYSDDPNFDKLRRTTLLSAMDTSEEVEDTYRRDVESWLDSQQFIYPPSVRQKEIVSRETGRVEFDSPPWKRISQMYEEYQSQSETYNSLLDQEVPAEDARAVLGMGTKINMTFTMNARALMHLFDMRAAGDAQWEIRDLSETLIEASKEWMPFTFEYYDENLRNRKNRLGP